MNSLSTLRSGKVTFPWILLLLIFILPLSVFAEGTPELRTADGDPVLLFVGEDEFGDFASYNGPAKSRLNFVIGEAGETVYFGLSRLFQRSGEPESFGQYAFRVRSAADGSVVFGPVTVNANNENLTTYEQAVTGPDVLGPGGYPTNEDYTFVAPQAGTYFIEFEQNRLGRPRYIGLWDISIVKNGIEQTGRVYSQNWAFRVPELNPELPDCDFGAELSTVFYSYTADGFVTMIDFRNSGFQPLSFNLAFNRTGPGGTGDLIEDRKSISGHNATDNAAEHLIFLTPPDPLLFPDGECGTVSSSGEIRCQGEGSFCIPVQSTLSGQIEIILDFDGNGIFDEGQDRRLLYAFSGDGGEACVPWDGRRGDGTLSGEGETVDILIQYTQGLQHWALFDGELMRNGFCVTPLRPICGSGERALLHYDDSNIEGETGTNASKTQLDGCDCASSDCRTWSNFAANAGSDCSVIDANTTGYGDRNTLNTWWFASSTNTASFDVPVSLASLTGPAVHCPGTPVDITLQYSAESSISTISWSGPNGPISTTPLQEVITVTESGLYTAVVVDEFGCSSETNFSLMDVSCSLNINVLSVSCQDAGTDTDPADDVYVATISVEGEGIDGFQSNGVTRNYGEVFTIGPFPVSGGNISFAATDNIFSCCAEEVEINAPLPCSDGCAITSASIQRTDCMDNGTPTDPSDDLFTFTMIIDGVNLGSNWRNDRGATGPYGVPLTFGPFAIADGAQNFTFTDVNDADCVIFATVQAPNSCSSDCVLTPVVSNLMCADGGTPFDPSDDVYTFDMLVEGVNTASVGYQLDGAGAFLYGQTNRFGPFPIAGDDFTFLIQDMGDSDCSLVFPLEERPVSCSTACGLEVADAIVTCSDEGTTASADDRLVVEVLVNTQNTGSTEWVASNGQSGVFGSYTRIGTIAPGGVDLTLEIRDPAIADCFATVTVTSPALTVDCPEPQNTTNYPVSLQSFADSLTTESDSLPGVQDICWIANDTLWSGRRFTQRYTLERTDTLEPSLRLFSFYLYAPVEQEFLGAVFSQSGQETLDCCNLTNDGPVTALPTNLLSLPGIPDTLQPAGMVLQQRFSVALRTDEVYSLITSSPSPEMIGEYVWLILSADQEELHIDRVAGQIPVQQFTTVDIPFELLLSELSGISNNPSSLTTFGVPVIDSICGEANIAFTDSLLRTCDRAQLIRTFDLNVGGTAITEVCTQPLTFRNLELADITWPPSAIQFGCSDVFLALDNGYPHPDFSGYPFVYREGRAIALDTFELDDLRIRFADTATLETDGSTRVTREWSVVDVCQRDTAFFEQVFKLDSNGEPFFSCPENNHYCPIVEEDIMLWPVGHFDCTADVPIPLPVLNNVCDTSGWIFTTEAFAVTSVGDTVLIDTLDQAGDRILEDLTPGDYLIRYTGVHPQETISEQYCRFRVADLSEPVTICKSLVNLSIPGGGIIRVTPRMIDQGSYDNCGIAQEELRRRVLNTADSLVWSPWSDFLFFDCEDVGIEWEVEYRITDTAGNQNFCFSTIEVLDNTDPYCTGLVEQFVSCNDLPDGFTPFDTTQLRLRFGMPEVVDNCSARAIELAPIVAGDICSPDRIRRRFRAIDQHGNFSAGLFFQDINISPVLGYAVEFPADLDTDCTDLTDTLRLIGTACDSITVSFTDIALPDEAGACRVFERVFTVTNWCEWDGVSPAITVGRDEDCDGAAGETAVWLVRTTEGAFVDADSLITNMLPAENSRGEQCGGQNPEGYYRQLVEENTGRYTYRQRIRIFDVTAPEIKLTMLDTICVDTSFCRTVVTVGIELEDACQVAEGEVRVNVDFNDDGTFEGDSDVIGTLSGSFPDYTYSLPMPIGDHRFEVVVTDDCGNTDSVVQSFRVNDCYVPALVCRGDRIYNLEPVLEGGDIDGDGVIEEAAVMVEAVELARCNFSDCSGDLTFSVNRLGEAVDRTQGSLFLDCEDRYSVVLEVYVWDNAFNPFSVQPDGTIGGNNWRSCEVMVFVQDPDLVCNDCSVDDNITISGTIRTRRGTPITSVRVTETSGATSVLTSDEGRYQMLVTANETHELVADLPEDDPRTGISTLDILLLRHHLLGITPITDPYALLAADADRDGSLTALDIVTLQGLVLNRESFFPSGSPWRFIAADWDGTGAPVTHIVLEDNKVCSGGHDFVGIKFGDINNSLLLTTEDGLAAVSTKEQAAASMQYLQVADKTVTAGSEITTSIALPKHQSWIGGQVALSWDREVLTLLDYSSPVIHEEQMHYDKDRLLVSWSDELPAEQLVRLTFRAKASGKLQDLLQVAEASDFRAEAYLPGFSASPIGLEWMPLENSATSAANLLRAQDFSVSVFPNPATTTVQLGFELATAQSAKLIVRDVSGRTILEASPQLTVGKQSLPVDIRDWPRGTYSFSLRTEREVYHGKIVKQGVSLK